MPSVFDVARCIIKKQGPMTAMKLQKLVYYTQAWSLVWDEKPIFTQEIQAWANGPVVPELYNSHKGMFRIGGFKGDSAGHLEKDHMETIDSVLEFYGPMTSQQLSDLTHSEAPWREARKGLADGERGNKIITHASMHEYYSSL
jgi:uncharacterized phage-associated protein